MINIILNYSIQTVDSAKEMMLPPKQRDVTVMMSRVCQKRFNEYIK